MDGSGRPNNTFTHTVIAHWSELADQIGIPIRALSSESWLTPYGALEVANSSLNEVSFFPEFLEYDWADVLIPNLDTFTAVLDTLDASVQQRRADPAAQRPLIVLRTSDMHRGVQWLEAIMSVCLPVDAWSIHYSTYERHVDQHRAGQLSSAGFDIVITRDADVSWSNQTLVVELDASQATIVHGEAPSSGAMSWSASLKSLISGMTDPVGIVSVLSELETLQADYQPHPSQQLAWGVQLLLIERRQEAGQKLGDFSAAILHDVSQEIPADTQVSEILAPIIPMVFDDPQANVATLLHLVNKTSERHTKASLLNGLVLRVLSDQNELEQLYPFDDIPSGVPLPPIDIRAIFGEHPALQNPFHGLNALLLLQRISDPQRDDILWIAKLWAQTVTPEIAVQGEPEFVSRLRHLRTEAPAIAELFADVVADEFGTAREISRVLPWHLLHTLRSAEVIAGVADQELLEGTWRTGSTTQAIELASTLVQDPQYVADAARNFVTFGFASTASLENILQHMGCNSSVRTVILESSPHLTRLAAIFLGQNRDKKMGNTSVDELSRFYLSPIQAGLLDAIYLEMFKVINFFPRQHSSEERLQYLQTFNQLLSIRATSPIAEQRCGEAVGHAWLQFTETHLKALSGSREPKFEKLLHLRPQDSADPWHVFLPGMISVFETFPDTAGFLWAEVRMAAEPQKLFRGEILAAFEKTSSGHQMTEHLRQASNLLLAVFDRAAGGHWEKTARRALEASAKDRIKTVERELKRQLKDEKDQIKAQQAGQQQNGSR